MAQPIEIPDCAKKLLEFLYPTVDWSRVTFFSGLPWWVASGTSAITIPDPLNGLGYRVYLGANTDFCDDTTIDTIVHESFHLQQFMGLDGGYGACFLRWGFFNYFVCYFAKGFSYEDNPFEQGAYAQEAAFARCHTTKVCDCSGGKPVFDPAALDVLVKCNPALVIRKPTTPSCASSWWAFVLALIAVPIIAIVMFLLHLIDLFDCAYLQSQSQQCTQWAQNSRDECNQWADQGYNQCNQWADQGYNRCCDWAPCSWFCKLLVWVSKWVCTITVWITNWVCIIVVTIIEWVCVVTITIFKTIFFCWLR